MQEREASAIFLSPGRISHDRQAGLYRPHTTSSNSRIMFARPLKPEILVGTFSRAG